MNNIELFKDENSNKLVQKLDNLTINLGEDNQDVLNIDSSVYVNNIKRHIPDEFKTTDKNKYLIVDTNNNYKYVDLNLDNSKFRFHKICSEKPDLEDTSNIISPVDGDIHLKMNETMLILLNFSGWRQSAGTQTWTFKYRIKGTGIYLAFDYPKLGQFKHYYNASSDHQHRSGQIVFNSSSQDIIIDSFQVDFTDRMDPNDFVSMNALIIPNNYLKSVIVPDKYNSLINKEDTNYQDQTKLLLSYPFKRGVDGNDGQRNYGSINNSDMTIDFVYHSFNQYEGFTIRNDQTPFNNISFRKTSGNFNNSGDDFTLYLRWRKTGSVPGENYARLISAWNGTSSTTRLQVNFEENVNDVVGEPNNYLRLWFGDTGTSHVEIATTITADRWYNLIIVVDNTNSEAKVYMDNTTQGILEYIGSLDRSSVSNYVFSNISLGRYRYDNSSYEFDGDFSDFYLFNDKLTIQQSQDWVNYVLNDYKSNYNAGSELITNGDSEIWNKPTTNNLIGIDNDSSYNAVTVNKDNTALTCMSNNEVIQLPAGTTLQRPNITKNGQIRYNTTTSCYEIYKQNSWKKIITSDISINTQVNMEVTDSSYYNQMPAPYSASICLLHRDFAGDGRYDDESPYTSYGAYVNIERKEYAPIYSEYFGRYVWYENSFDTIIYDSSPEHNMAYVRKFQPGENPRDTVTDSDTWNGGGIVIRKSGTYIMYYSTTIRHTNGTFSTAFYKNNTNISQQTGTTTKTINGIGHNFIDKNYTAYLQEGDLIRIRSYHDRNSHTIYGQDNMSAYDYNDPTNPYNYDYMLKIASKLTVRLLDSTSIDSGGGGSGGGGY